MTPKNRRRELEELSRQVPELQRAMWDSPIVRHGLSSFQDSSLEVALANVVIMLHDTVGLLNKELLNFYKEQRIHAVLENNKPKPKRRRVRKLRRRPDSK